MTRALFILASLLALGACAEPLESITDVRKPRVLGALVRVQGEPDRATPGPGETVEVELVVADPGPRTGRSFVFIVCAPADTQLDRGLCERFVAGPFIGGLPAEDEPKPAPSFAFEVPDEAELGEQRALLVLGAVCADGGIDASFDPSAFMGGAETANPCVDQSKRGQLLTLSIALEREPAHRNHVPRFETIAFEGVPWGEVADEGAPETGCVGTGLPERLYVSGELGVHVTLTEGSRETFTLEGEDEPFVEEPFLAFHATAGDFRGAYAFFDDTPSDPSFFWEMPPRSTIPAEGLLVRFWLVLRDRRGGSSAAERALCLVP